MKARIILFLLITTALLALSCATSGKSRFGDDSEEALSSIGIYVEKENLDTPLKIQVSNRSMEIIEYLTANCVFIDSTDGFECAIAIDVIDPNFQSTGDTERANLRYNSTQLYYIRRFEFAKSPCWDSVVGRWPNIAVHCEIADK
jgi:hypothetical protein